jgi:UDP-N-acetylglucosamine:LPS N-acetylglucosamine transferase
VQERELTPERLSDLIAELTRDRAPLLKMAEASRSGRVVDAAARLADFCMAGARA